MEAAHFELTEESQRACTGEKVFRIRAIRDIPERFVKAGDLGGWVSSVYTSTSELRIGPRAWVADDAVVAGDARVCDDALVYGAAQISGCALIAGHARVYGWAEVDADARVKEYARVFGFANVTDNATITGCARVYGDTMVSGHATVSGFADMSGTSQVGKHAKVSGWAQLRDETTVTDHATVTGRAEISGDSWLCDTATITGRAKVRDSWVQDSSQIHNAEVRGATLEGESIVRANLPYGVVVIDAQILTPHHCEVFCSTYFVTMFRTAENQIELAILDPDRSYLGADETTLLAHMPDMETAEEMRQLVAGSRRRILGEHTPAELTPDTSMRHEPFITALATINGEIAVAEESTIARATLSGTGRISGVIKAHISLEVSGEMTELFVLEKEDYRELFSERGTIRMIRRRCGYYLQRKENGWEQINADELGESAAQWVHEIAASWDR
ncbi:hypothetical protein CMUST_07230 [Corynebacterium mustelae]|uniref:Polymer-forming cytoskeletal protein n=1 Tax=Corynebacterium mustelae TaxID=571915 RepID=A0A0G3GX76_9CORY|nr:hypothetical protein [Corynebacterium mustelae]AKK05776.1 hypothetical protein CMUST_07230 [Corynebacterium mustelae]